MATRSRYDAYWGSKLGFHPSMHLLADGDCYANRKQQTHCAVEGVNITKQELCRSKKNCNFFNVLTIARTLALILSPVYLGLCWFETDLFYTTHVGALTIFLVWSNVTFTLGKYPTFGIYITIVNYVGLEVLKLVILYMTTFIGDCLI